MRYIRPVKCGFVFPNGKYDDQIDSTSQALAWTKQRPAGWGLLQYYRHQADNIRNPARSTMVRLDTLLIADATSNEFKSRFHFKNTL